MKKNLDGDIGNGADKTNTDGISGGLPEKVFVSTTEKRLKEAGAGVDNSSDKGVEGVAKGKLICFLSLVKDSCTVNEEEMAKIIKIMPEFSYTITDEGDVAFGLTLNLRGEYKIGENGLCLKTFNFTDGRSLVIFADREESSLAISVTASNRGDDFGYKIDNVISPVKDKE